MKQLALFATAWLAVWGPAAASGPPPKNAPQAPATQPAKDLAMWTIFIANDNCPDYTWGLTEQQTRKAFADIVRGHLDEMNRTDSWDEADRDRYNMAVTQEALCFVEHYPARKEELIRRIKEGRVYVSPYLCNSLWAFQGLEGAIRTFYPARRLEREWGIPMDVAEHMEEPSLPWGAASILAGCGIRWLSVPFYSYDSTFGGLKNPPVFDYEGPDGAKVRVVMDPWACNRSSYTQGAHLLKQPDTAAREWVPHFAKMGQRYGARAVLASGTHGDIAPGSGGQARQYAEAIRKHNAAGGEQPRLINAALPQFCRAVDEAEARTPFLQTLRGCFGHSWDLWPVCLARYAAAMREGERRMLAAEALLAVADDARGMIRDDTRADRQRAEWCWAMLSDHAWNGTGEPNKRHNADLRRDWAAELNRIAGALTQRGWQAAGLQASGGQVAIFNSLSIARSDLVRIEGFSQAQAGQAVGGGKTVPCQVVPEDGKDVAYFVAPRVPGFGFAQAVLSPGGKEAVKAALRASDDELDGPFYQLKADPKTGGLASLIHKPTGIELLAPAAKRTLCQTVYHDGKEHALEGVKAEVVAAGPVLARLRSSGTMAGMDVTTDVTIYAELDRVDFDIRIRKPTTTARQRLCQVFPVMRDKAALRIETTGAVLRPRPQPEGDLLPGADTRRFAVQGFVSIEPAQGARILIAPLDAFCLRMDLEPLTFEALGNDQNYREVVQDQHGEKDFRFRYALTAGGGRDDKGAGVAAAVPWARCVATPLLAAAGKLDASRLGAPPVEIDRARAAATCLKPADDPAAGGTILRIQEIAGRAGPIRIGLPGWRKAIRTDLLERDLEELKIDSGAAGIELRANGFAALRLLR